MYANWSSSHFFKYSFSILEMLLTINHSKMNNQDIIKVRVHDGIVGLIYLISVALADQFATSFIWIAIATAVLQILSPITKFCPVYTILNKIMPDSTPIQNGKRS